MRIEHGDCGDSGDDGGLAAPPLQTTKFVESPNATYATDPTAATATVPEVDLTDVAIVDNGIHQPSPPAEKTAFLSLES